MTVGQPGPHGRITLTFQDWSRTMRERKAFAGKKKGRKKMPAWNFGFMLAGIFFTGYFFGYHWMVSGTLSVVMVMTEPVWFMLAILPLIYGASGLARDN